MNVYTSLGFSFTRKERYGVFEFDVRRSRYEGDPVRWVVTWANRVQTVMETAALVAKVEANARDFDAPAFLKALETLPRVDERGRDFGHAPAVETLKTAARALAPVREAIQDGKRDGGTMGTLSAGLDTLGEAVRALD